MANESYVSEIKGDISEDPNIIEIPEIMIHGNPPRAWQCGYGANYPKYNESNADGSPKSGKNRSGYPWPNYVFPVNGIQDSNPDAAGSITNQIKHAYRNEGITISPSGGHAGGNPACVMYIKLKDFKTKPGGALEFMIEDAHIRQFPGPMIMQCSDINNFTTGPLAPNTYAPGGRRGVGPEGEDIYGPTTIEYNMPPIWWDRDGSYNPQSATNMNSWHTFCNEELSQIEKWNHRGARHGALGYAGILSTISYDFIVDGEIVSTGELMSKEEPYHIQGISQAWASYEGGSNVLYWTEEFGKTYMGITNKRITGPGPGSENVLFSLRIESQCNCDQTLKARPLLVIDITKKFKKEPYIWRKFGTSASNDPEGNRINPSKLDGNWHLVEPLYTMIKPRSKRIWQDVSKEPEDEE